MVYVIGLPKLNRLNPSMQSTLLKLVEEAGELARAALHFLPYEHEPLEAAALSALEEVNLELLDVAQTCVTMIFVLEESQGIVVDRLIYDHLRKLESKGYAFDRDGQYQIYTGGGYKYLSLPRLHLPETTLLTTSCKIQEEIGELTQFLGKKSGASGETASMTKQEAIIGSAYELLDVAQCCFTMMYLLTERYAVDMESLVERHIDKLRRRGYCD